MRNSPAKLLSTVLSGSGKPFDSDWPIYISHMPDGEGVQDNVATIYDTSGHIVSRMLRTGEVIEKHGLTLEVRSANYDAAYARIGEAVASFDIIKNTHIVIEPYTYIVEFVQRTSSIFSLGVEVVGSKRRRHLAVHCLVSVRESVNS